MATADISALQARGDVADFRCATSCKAMRLTDGLRKKSAACRRGDSLPWVRAHRS